MRFYEVEKLDGYGWRLRRVSYIDYGATERPVMTSKISKKKVRH